MRVWIMTTPQHTMPHRATPCCDVCCLYGVIPNHRVLCQTTLCHATNCVTSRYDVPIGMPMGCFD